MATKKTAKKTAAKKAVAPKKLPTAKSVAQLARAYETGALSRKHKVIVANGEAKVVVAATRSAGEHVVLHIQSADFITQLAKYAGIPLQA